MHAKLRVRHTWLPMRLLPHTACRGVVVTGAKVRPDERAERLVRLPRVR